MSTKLVARKPSEILRDMPRDKWIRGAYTDGGDHYCAAGWLGKEAGAEFVEDEDTEGEWDMRLGDSQGICVVYDYYGISSGMFMARLNDHGGLDAVIADLEEQGL